MIGTDKNKQKHPGLCIRFGLLFLFLTMWNLLSAQPADSTAGIFSLSGYVKELPYFQKASAVPFAFNSILNLRLNSETELTKNTNLVLELRNRLLYGDANWGEQPVVESFRTNNGWLNLGTAAGLGKRALVHLQADRFYLEHNSGKWQFRLGRQRINWGINTVSNPNDLFNTYSFFDFDYPERPGSDAVRVQYYISDLSHAEVALAPAGHIRGSVGAFLYSFNLKGYDLQIISGYYHNRLTLGGGWAGQIRNAGFKGEANLFTGLSGTNRKTTLVASVSGDYMFGNSLYLMVEALYNGGYRKTGYGLPDLYTPLSADNLMFSEYAVTASLTYPFSPIINGSFSAMSLPDIDAWFLSPALTVSAGRNLDLSLMAQIFTAGEETGGRLSAFILIGSLQYSF